MCVKQSVEEGPYSEGSPNTHHAILLPNELAVSSDLSISGFCFISAFEEQKLNIGA